MAKKYLEDKLQLAIAAYLYDLEEHTDEFYFYHIPNQGIRTKRTGAKFKRMGMRAGVSDIIIHTKNKTLCIELKTQDGKQSKSQKAFQQKMESLGIAYHIIKTDIPLHAVAHLKDILKNYIDAPT